ncbi:DUF3189 family protein [Bacillus taeanensis]|uniref:ABC transporter n=1 Tax=Bacillus taeanensis TaxID=273032 RepID=A0A366XLP4_9BACI|nr:DUF3189 family protein [Bacillus taeanensis]RBW67290.1 ABC transporter [Bacillus taeanensis]
MIFVYNCYGGTHSSVLAAAYHLKKLPEDREPTKEEVLHVDIFNKLTHKDMGKLIFHGKDENQHSVYTIGRGRSKALIPALKNLSVVLQAPHKEKERIIFSNTSPTVPIAMTIGGFFSRGLKIDAIGVPLLVIGAKQAHFDLIRLVHHTKMLGTKMDDSVKILDNKTFK